MLVTFTNGHTLEYVYDAGGNKLRKIVRQNGVMLSEQDYAGGLEYRKIAAGSRRVESLYHTEGRYYNLNAEMSNTLNWRKEYHLRDHLGNTRLTFADKNNNGIVDVTNNPTTNEILQELHYYPFGLAYEGPWLMNDAARDEMYRYNGIGWEELSGLYVAEFRSYDPAMGRWLQVDMLADWAPNWTPYRNGFNNPLSFNDPLGLFESRQEARQFRRENGIKGGISREKDAAGDKSFVLTERGTGDEYYYGSYSQGATDDASAVAFPIEIIRASPESGFWERQANGTIGQRLLYSAANGINVLVRSTFTGRGEPVQTLGQGFVTKGSSEHQDSWLDGYMAVMGTATAGVSLPSVAATGSSVSSQTVNAMDQEFIELAILKFRRIDGGFLINNSLRIQIHRHGLSPIKGRRISGGAKFSGMIKATHLNINRFHVIFNPTKWNALSTWRYTPFRFKN